MSRSRDPVGRAVQIVRYLAEHPAQAQGVREIATALGMQPSSVSRSLVSLAQERLVQRDPRTGGYSPHIELIRLGLLTSQKLDIRSVARPHLEKVVTSCNESVFLGVYDAAAQQMLRVDSVQSSNPLRYVVELDRWTEVYRGASGLGILAFLPVDEREPLLELADSKASESEPWLNRAELESFMDTIRARGYAHTKGRRIDGAVGISAPIFAANGRVIGDVILTVPEIRFDPDDEQRLAGYVIRAASNITSSMGGTPLPAWTDALSQA